MTAITDRVLLELAIGETVAIARRSLDRNRRGDGSPSAAFGALAIAMERFDRLGGLEALTLALWGGPVDAAPLRLAPARLGGVPPASPAEASAELPTLRLGPAGLGAVATLADHQRGAGR